MCTDLVLLTEMRACKRVSCVFQFALKVLQLNAIASVSLATCMMPKSRAEDRSHQFTPSDPFAVPFCLDELIDFVGNDSVVTVGPFVQEVGMLQMLQEVLCGSRLLRS